MVDARENSLEIRNSIVQSLKEKNVVVPAEFKEVFEHHLDVLIYRIQNNECTDYKDAAVEDQVTGEDLQIAQDILVPLFDRYNVKENRMEEVLLAIYIQLAKGEKTV